MTLSNSTSTITYVASGTNREFSIPFPFNDDTHLVVTVEGASRTLNVDFTVEGATLAPPGQITFTEDATPDSGESVIISRIVPYTQPFEYLENGQFPAETHEKALDNIVMMIQQIVNTPGTNTNSPLTLSAPTGSATVKSMVVSGPTYHRVHSWLVAGTNTLPTLETTLVPPNGNQEFSGLVPVMTDEDGNYTFTFTHTGSSRSWRLCVESGGFITLGSAFTLGV